MLPHKSTATQPLVHAFNWKNARDPGIPEKITMYDYPLAINGKLYMRSGIE